MAGAGKQTATRRARDKVKGQAKKVLAEEKNEGNEAVKGFLAGESKLKLAQIVGSAIGGGYYNIKFGEDEPSIKGRLDKASINTRKVKRALKKVDRVELPKDGDFVIVEWDKEQAEKNQARAAVNKKHKVAAANIIALVPNEQEVRVKKHAKWGAGGLNAAVEDFMGMAPKPANNSPKDSPKKEKKSKKQSDEFDVEPLDE